MASASIVNRADAWPIVVSTFHGNAHSVSTLDQAIDTWFEWRGRGPHVMIVDLRQGYAGATAQQRAHLADRVRKLLKATDPDESKHQQVALILVFDNAVVRGLITAVLWLVPTKMVPRMVGTMEQAIEMAVTELQKVGIHVPPGVGMRARGPATVSK